MTRMGMLLLPALLLTLLGGMSVRAAGPDQEAEEPLVRLVAAMRASVVAVGSYDPKDTPTVRFAGTGFVVGDGRMVATNAHVVEALEKINKLDTLRVFFPDAPQREALGAQVRPVEGRPARVLAKDAFHDVAILGFEGPPAPALELSDAVPPQGRSVGVLGYPIGMALGLVPAVHKGTVAAVVPAVLPLPKGARLTPAVAEALKNPYHLYQLDLVIFPGHSGSPLFDARDGKVLGIINKTLAAETREHLLDKPSGVGYAVPIVWVQRLLRETSTTEPTPAGSK